MERRWRETYDVWKRENPQLAAALERALRQELPSDLPWPSFDAENGSVATRDAGGSVMNAIAMSLPELVGGSADLDPSTKTYLKNCGDFEPGNYSGRNIHYGVREHAMAACTNGIALHGGLLPFAATFFNFLDYLKPALRLGSLTGIHSIYVFTHDSVFLGEDGPTHQPIEQLATLRATPNCYVVRPADSLETLEAWKLALARKGAPWALVLTRQKVPFLGARDAAVSRGAYVLSEAAGGDPDLVLIATGSEVSLAVDAKKILQDKGVRVRVVSMPCWELFDAQPQSYKDDVLPPSIAARMSIEAGATLGWSRVRRRSRLRVRHRSLRHVRAGRRRRPILRIYAGERRQRRPRKVCTRRPLGETDEEPDPATARRRAERVARQPPPQYVRVG